MSTDIAKTVQQAPQEYARRLDRLDRLAHLLDGRFRIPGTNVRFGWDPIVGLVPVAGDLAMAAVAAHLIGQARELGADGRLIGRMVANVLVDLVVGAIPFIGPVFDLFFKSNLKNLHLLNEEIRRQLAKGGGGPAPPAERA